MDTATVVNIILCILSFILAAISVITVILTLKQNNKMIENSTRPYVVMTAQRTNIQTPCFYLVIKNYGASGATVKSITFDIDIGKYSLLDFVVPFSEIANTFLAPNQCIFTQLDHAKLRRDKIAAFYADIKYTDGIHEYSEHCPINYKGYSHNVGSRATTNGKELKIISEAMQDLIEKQF